MRPTKFVARAALGWGPSPAARVTPRSGLVVHYDSVDQRLAGKPHSECVAYWKRTRSFHTGPSRGWADIGYSFMACAHGYVLEGRGLFRTQAAQPGGNSSHYSVTLATGPTDQITDAQINAVRQLRAWLMADHGVAGAVKGHRDFVSTSCPGDKAYQMVRDGVFSQPPGTTIKENPLIGLEKGDRGEAVKALQELIKFAGQGAALGPAGVDGHYWNGTAEGLRLARASVGSAALPGYGDKVTGHAYAQLIAAVARHQAKTHGSGTSGGGLPGSEQVTITGTLTRS